MRKRIVALVVLLVPVIGAADDFMAMPGLWKTSYETAQDASSGANTAEPQILWHCVDEEADPWTEFARLLDTPGMSCARPTLERTSTSLKWKIECKGAATVTGEGSIVFDSPQHYTGSVRFSGTLLGYPLRSVTRIEGQRFAACTSPKD
jgi:hypothetical protein